MAEGKMLPRITEDKRSFFVALREGKFITTRCGECGTVSFPPRMLCPACLGDRREWVPLSGRGRIYAFTLNRIVPRGLIKESPYLTAMVDLAEGPRILTRIEGAAYEDLEIGAEVQVGFMTLAEGYPFFYFEPVAER